MNQRKVIGALSILLLAILFISVGCGDGRRETRTRLHKTVPQNKGQKPLNLNSKEAKAQKAAREQAKTEFERAIMGEKLSLLPPGTYELTEILSFVNFMKTSKGGEEVSYFRRISVGSQGAIPGQQVGYGIFKNNPDKGRQIIAPLSFQMVSGSGITRHMNQSLLFSTQLKDDASNMSRGLVVQMDDQVGPAAGSQAPLLTDYLPQAQTGVRMTDGKSADFFIIKQGNDRIAVQVAVNEIAQPGNQNNISEQAANAFSRHMVFIYTVKPPKTDSTSGAPTPAAPSPSASSPPVADPDTGE